jgi:two-component system response regulator RstA
MVILDSENFFEELSTLPRIRAVYTGLLILLIDDIDEMLQVLLYEQGVDDLLVIPINHLLMVARIRALFRRARLRSTPANLSFNGLEINQGLRRASYLGEEIPFTSREFDLLWHLARHACVTLDRDNLYRAVFGIEYNGYDRSIDMYIARIRSKMAFHPDLVSMIKTVRGSGYLLRRTVIPLLLPRERHLAMARLCYVRIKQSTSKPQTKAAVNHKKKTKHRLCESCGKRQC